MSVPVVSASQRARPRSATTVFDRIACGVDRSDESFGPVHLASLVADPVALHGEVEGRSDAQLIERMVARVPGVVGVRSELTWRVDDLSRKYQRNLARTRS
jgi:hypothetical protein